MGPEAKRYHSNTQRQNGEPFSNFITLFLLPLSTICTVIYFIRSSEYSNLKILIPECQEWHVMVHLHCPTPGPIKNGFCRIVWCGGFSSVSLSVYITVSGSVDGQRPKSYSLFIQVAPAELEALLLTHPSMADSGVIGIPDPSAGQLPKAFIVIKPGHKLTKDEIDALFKGMLCHLMFNINFLITTHVRSTTGR